MDLMETQRTLEDEMSRDGLARYNQLITQAQSKEREGDTVYGQEMLRTLVLPVGNAIKTFVKEAQAGGPGRRHAAVAYLAEHDPMVLGYITVRAAINSVSSRSRTLTSAALAIASAVENECRYKYYSSEAGKLFAHMVRNLKEKTADERWRRSVMVHVMNKHGFRWTEWPKSDKLHIGQALINCLIEQTGLWEVGYITLRRKRKTATLTPKQELLDVISQKAARCSLLSPTKIPMVIPPAPWGGPYGGGYHYLPEPMPIITGRVSKNYLEDMSNNEAMASIYECLNTIQEVPWRINNAILHVLRDLWDRGGTEPVAGLPGSDPRELPAKPHDIETNEQARKEWRSQASIVHLDNRSQGGRRLLINSLVYLAEKFQGFERIYFPHNLDSRGRVYAIPTHLSPQGHDASRGLLEFAEGKPIDNPRSKGWLMIDGANLYGEDKVPFDERIAWVEENTDRFVAMAADPLSDMVWAEADKPWQFLAWAMDYAGLVNQGYGYVSHRAVALDGSCNGLQHLSAMLRDSKGAQVVNLSPGDKPQDVYQRVADATIEALRERAGEDELARKWLEVGVDRKICKRPVMIVPYSGTKHASRKYIEEHMESQHGQQWADKDDRFKASFYLAPIMWDTINQEIAAAREVMTFLTDIAKVTTQAELPLQWSTPDGFVVQQAYWSLAERQIKTRMGDRLVYLTLREAKKGGKLDMRDQKNGAPPNFVHSFDAAALRQYVLLGKDNDITSFSLVHDSFATHAADTDMSAACLRHAFVSIYEDRDVLADLLEQVRQYLPTKYAQTLPEKPELGDFDIQDVLESTYFFA